MTQRLNITNGDSAAGTLSEAGVEGKIISWRDVLHEGPVDSSLSLEELSKRRARFIAEQGWDDFAHVSVEVLSRGLDCGRLCDVRVHCVFAVAARVEGGRGQRPRLQLHHVFGKYFSTVA